LQPGSLPFMPSLVARAATRLRKSDNHHHPK
jgi:hypothetical protein